MSRTAQSGTSISPPSARIRFAVASARARSRHPLSFFVAKRLVALVLLGLGVTLIAFVLTHLVPGDPAEANLGQRAGSDPVAVQVFREHYGLDKPLPVQYVVYVTNLLRGDMGESEQSRRPVRADLGEYIPATAELAVTSIVLSGVLGVGLGVLAALRRNQLTDQVLRVVSLGGMSMPSFWLALVALYVFYYQLSWVPGSGRLDAGISSPPHLTGMFSVDALLSGRMDVFSNAVQHLILPACVLAAFNMGLFTRFTRSAVLEVLDNDYVRTARAKGLSEWRVVGHHAVRNSLITITTLIGLQLGALISGAVITETIFGIAGFGRLTIDAIDQRDYTLIQGVVLVAATGYVVVNLLVDVVYSLLNPRIRVS
jgi:peptide/nickel transport system permease protein